MSFLIINRGFDPSQQLRVARVTAVWKLDTEPFDWELLSYEWLSWAARVADAR